MAENNEIVKSVSTDVVSMTCSFSEEDIRNRIYTIRGVQVILDRDLAFLYNVETRRINEAVKRNPLRFPDDFHFQLTKEEYSRSQNATSRFESNLKSQFAISNGRGGVE